jgi:hypothetical protein
VPESIDSNKASGVAVRRNGGEFFEGENGKLLLILTFTDSFIYYRKAFN